MRPQPVTIIGLGNTLMGDDGVGPAVIERLASTGAGNSAGVELVDGQVKGMALVGSFLGSRAVIVVDAIDVGAEPGAIFRLPAEEVLKRGSGFEHAHGLGLAHLLTYCQLQGKGPDTVVVYGVQIGSTAPALHLCPPVEAALDRVVELVTAEATALTMLGHSSGFGPSGPG